MKQFFLGFIFLGFIMSVLCLDCSAQTIQRQPAETATTRMAGESNSAESSEEVYWNQFRGPNGQGVMNADNVPVHFGPDSNVLWKTAIDEGQSSPVIWGDRIFLTTYSPKNQDELTTVCLDRKQGRILWRKSVSAGKKVRYHSMNGPASPTPAVDHKHVYVYFGTYGLLCYDHDGTKVWEHRLEPPANQYGTSVSPILYKDKVILVLDDNDRKSRLLAVNRDTGTTVWEQPRALFQAGWSTPMIWRHALGDELVVLGSRRLTSYDAATGEEIWWAGGFSTETIGVPVTGEGLLFVSDAATGGRGETEWDAELTWKITLEDFEETKTTRYNARRWPMVSGSPCGPTWPSTNRALPIRSLPGRWMVGLETWIKTRTGY